MDGTEEIWFTYMLCSNTVLYWKLYVKAKQVYLCNYSFLKSVFIIVYQKHIFFSNL